MGKSNKSKKDKANPEKVKKKKQKTKHKKEKIKSIPKEESNKDISIASILEYLKENGYTKTLKTLQTEMNVDKTVITDSSSEPKEDEVSDTDVSDVSSVSSTDVSDSEDEVNHNLKKAQAQEAREAAKKAAENWTPKTSLSTPKSKSKSIGTPFARVDSNYWSEHAAKDGVEDNTYEKAFGNEGFGAKSSEKLIRVRGKDFRHEKTKRKRTFNGFSRTGGNISQASNSVKFNYNSD